MINILTQSLWRDEAFSALLSVKDLGQIISVTASDFSPPLYYIFLHFWIKLFGFGELSLRIPSLLFLVFTACITFFLGKKLFSKRIGFLAAFFLLLNPLFFYYAFEARMYTLFSFFAALSFYFLIFENWPLFILFSLLGLYSHNFMIFSLLGELAAYLSLRGFGRKKKLLVSLGCILLGFSPWVGVLFSQTKVVAHDFWIGRPGIREIALTPAQFLFGPSVSNLRYLILAALTFLLIALLWWFYVRREPRSRKEGATALLAWASLPFFSSFLTSYFVPVFVSRYLVFIAIPLSLFLAFILIASSLRIPLIFCFLALFLSRDVGIWWNPNKFPIRERMVSISNSWEGAPVVCESALNFFEVKYYLMRFQPLALEKVYLLSSGAVRYAGGALVEQRELIKAPPEGGYFWVPRSGDVSLRRN